MKSQYSGPWVVRVRDMLGSSEVVHKADTFPSARDESLRRNTAEGTTDKFFVVPADEDERWVL